MSTPASEAPGARVQAIFELRGQPREQLALGAAKLVHSLQQLACAPDCECDLDVSIDLEPLREP